jgi:hypothetical protein
LREEISLSVKVLEESDIMRAADRLASRVRGHQQTKVFAFQLFFIIIILSIFCNIIANLIINFLTVGLSNQELFILIVSIVFIPILAVTTYQYSRKYIIGGLGTFVDYIYSIPESEGGGLITLGENLWRKINPIEEWRVINTSHAATTDNEIALFLYRPGEMKNENKPNQYWSHLDGEFVYASFSRPSILQLHPLKIDLHEAGKVWVNCSCFVSINLVVEKKENRNIVNFNVTMNLKNGVNPFSDKLIEDTSVKVRLLVEKMQSSIATFAN